jgi:outer membrane protein TolC
MQPSASSTVFMRPFFFKPAMSRSTPETRGSQLPAAVFVQLTACLITATVWAQGATVQPAPQAAVPLAAPASQALPTPAASDPGLRPLERVDLRAAITRALQRSPSIALARAEIARAKGLLRQARAGMFPVLNANAAYTRLDEERRAGGQRIAARDQLGAELQLSVPLVVPRRWVEAGQASDQVELARRDAATDRVDLTLSVAQAYLTVMAQHRVIEVNERALANARAHYDYAHTRFTGGIGNQIDDVRAGQEVATSIAELERSQAGLVRAQEALGVLLGHDGAVDVVDQVELEDPGSLVQSLSDAGTRRPDIRASRARLQAAERVLDDSWADYMPFLQAEFRPFYSTPASPANPRTGWEAQLLLSVPLYDGGARYGAHDQREAELSQSRTQLEAALRQARSEVRVAFSTAERADASLRAAATAAELARQGLEMATLAYQAGATTNIEVLDAERSARDAETTAVVAEDAARQARLDLLVASGRWQ